jgi:DNA-binding response OmpR family regulator
MGKLIYLADDEKNIRDLIQRFLENDGFEVKTFHNGDSLLKAHLEHPSDLVILDIMMEGTNGLGICSRIRQTENVPIIFVSARDSESDRILGITMGGDDYLVKPFSPMELLTRVKAIFRRMVYSQIQGTESLLSYADIHLNLNTRECTLKNERLELTPTEFALLTYMFQNSHRAVSRDELMKNVWKFESEVDSRAADDVIKRLRKKLPSTSMRIESVWGFGFRLGMVGDEDTAK